ncbi:hypothetical protein BC829DRAFT_388336, partial [Chytridium lagenaria]
CLELRLRTAGSLSSSIQTLPSVIHLLRHLQIPGGFRRNCPGITHPLLDKLVSRKHAQLKELGKGREMTETSTGGVKRPRYIDCSASQQMIRSLLRTDILTDPQFFHALPALTSDLPPAGLTFNRQMNFSTLQRPNRDVRKRPSFSEFEKDANPMERFAIFRKILQEINALSPNVDTPSLPRIAVSSVAAELPQEKYRSVTFDLPYRHSNKFLDDFLHGFDENLLLLHSLKSGTTSLPLSCNSTLGTNCYPEWMYKGTISANSAPLNDEVRYDHEDKLAEQFTCAICFDLMLCRSDKSCGHAFAGPCIEIGFRLARYHLQTYFIVSKLCNFSGTAQIAAKVSIATHTALSMQGAIDLILPSLGLTAEELKNALKKNANGGEKSKDERNAVAAVHRRRSVQRNVDGIEQEGRREGRRDRSAEILLGSEQEGEGDSSSDSEKRVLRYFATRSGCFFTTSLPFSPTIVFALFIIESGTSLNNFYLLITPDHIDHIVKHAV